VADGRAAIALVCLSDSFSSSVEAMVSELSFAVVSVAAQELPPANVAAVVVLAGGHEAQAAESVPGLTEREAPVYVIGGSTDHRIAGAVLQRGATDYFALPGDVDSLRRALERLARRTQDSDAAAAFATDERKNAGFETIVGASPTLMRVVEQARRLAPRDNVTLLIEGETGTGKEVLARAIHYAGPRARQPFVEVNCTAIPENLLESELFGHEKGSFTGAIAAKQGLFELAHGGTLLLDEIGHLPLELQAKLLRALETRAIRRVGGNSTRSVDVRVIAATHVRLADAVGRGEFREDLFYRLNVVTLQLPALRERDGDVELLAERFVADLAGQHGLPAPELTAEIRDALRAHSWPGNVRELRNAIERALVLSPQGTLAPETLELAATRTPSEGAHGGRLPFPAPLESIIRAAVAAMLELTRGNKSEAARLLGISRPRLQRWLADDPDDRDKAEHS
jgi:DNA-binding NtrC family response regulator